MILILFSLLLLGIGIWFTYSANESDDTKIPSFIKDNKDTFKTLGPVLKSVGIITIIWSIYVFYKKNKSIENMSMNSSSSSGSVTGTGSSSNSSKEVKSNFGFRFY